MDADFRIEGLDELRAALRRFPEAAQRGAYRGMTKGVLRVQAAAREGAPVHTGRLRASIAYVVQRIGLGVRGIVGSAVKYAPFMEFGTKPHWPPKGALARWAYLHRIPDEYPIRAAIAARGLKARRFLRNAMEQEGPKVARDLYEEIRRELEKLME